MRRLIAVILASFLGHMLFAEAIPFLEPAPIITGKPGASSWKNAFQKQFESKTATVFLGRSQTHLFLAVHSEHGAIDYKVNTQTELDSPVYANDSLELFANTSGGRDFFQIIANVNGAVFDQRCDEFGKSDMSWDSGTKAAGSYGKDSFYIEMAVPLASLAPFNGKLALAVNSYQRWRLKGEFILGRPRHTETYTVFDMPGNFPIELTDVKCGTVAGSQAVTFSLKNNSERNLKLTGSCNGTPVSIQLKGGEAAELQGPVILEQGKMNIIELILLENGKDVLRAYRHVFPTPRIQAGLYSDIIYENEAVPVYFRVNEPQTENVRLEFQPNTVRCRYQQECIELKYETIPSPWNK